MHQAVSASDLESHKDSKLNLQKSIHTTRSLLSHQPSSLLPSPAAGLPFPFRRSRFPLPPYSFFRCLKSVTICGLKATFSGPLPPKQLNLPTFRTKNIKIKRSMACRSGLRKIGGFQLQRQSLHFSSYSYSSSPKAKAKLQCHETNMGSDGDDDDSGVPTAGISRPLSQILKDLNKKVPESLLRARTELSGSSIRYIPWHILNRILNVHAPEWSGEVRSITYSADGNSVSVVYRVTLYGTDAEIFREATGSASTSDTSYGSPVQKAEAMAFRRACARLGLGLHLYHEDLE